LWSYARSQEVCHKVVQENEIAEANFANVKFDRTKFMGLKGMQMNLIV
jgi:hypothetical protein